MNTATGRMPVPEHLDDQDPHAGVSAFTIGEAAEILALTAATAAAGPVIKPALARFLAGQGADPAHAMSWLAAGPGGALAFEGISTGHALDRYRSAGAGR